ncbi:MAG: thioredoxin [Syntrophales bacterium]|nr:thioredoxin [Syntrophales bacterium]
MGESVSVLTDETFDKTIELEQKPVLVDFWAPWCGPCRALAPAVEGIAQDYAGRLAVYKINVDENPKTASKLGIRSIPTLVLFNRGMVVDKMVGLVPQEQLEAFVRKVLPAEG